MHLDTAIGHVTRSRALDAEVDSRNCEASLPYSGNDVLLLGAHLVGEIGTEHLRAALHPGQQLVDRERCGRTAEDADAHGTTLTQVAGQRAGVDVADAHDPLLAQVVVESALRPPVGRDTRGIAHDVPGDPDAAALGVVIVDAVVADVRSGLDHDLSVVRRVRERLLVTRHPGGEHCLAERLPHRAVGATAEDAAVLEHQHGRLDGGQAAHAVTSVATMSPSSTVGRPPKKVATTDTGRVRPPYGELWLRLWSANGSTA